MIQSDEVARWSKDYKQHCPCTCMSGSAAFSSPLKEAAGRGSQETQASGLIGILLLTIPF